MLYLISGDETALPDSLAAFAASSALSVSDISFDGPISEVHVARIDGQFVINPSLADRDHADIDLMVGATVNHIPMVEGEMKEVSEDDMIEALKVAHEAIKVQCELQLELAAAVGATEKRKYEHETNDEALKQQLWDLLYDKTYSVAKQLISNKKERSKAFSKIIDEYLESLPEDTTVDKDL